MNRHLPLLSLCLLLAAAAAVMAAGWRLAHTQHEVRIPRDRTALQGFATSVHEQLRKLETRYEQDLYVLSQTVDSGNDRIVRERCVDLVGIVRSSILSSAEESSTAHHVDVDYLREIATIPRFRVGPARATTEPTAFVTSSRFFNGRATEGWIDEVGLPLAYWRRQNANEVMVFTLYDRAIQAAFRPVLLQSLPAYTRALTGPPSHERWLGPDGVSLSPTPLDPDAADRLPDFIIPLRTRFGTWLLQSWDQRRTEIRVHSPTLLISAVGSALLLILGIALFVSLNRTSRLATQRVSFVNRVSHELRTPLTNMLLNLDLAEEQLPPSGDAARSRLSLVRQESGRLARLIDNVLTFSQADQDRLQLHPSLQPIAPLLQAIVESFQPLLERRGIDLTVDLPLKLSASIDADAFTQIVTNLLSNIEKYAPGQPATLSVQQHDSTLHLRLHDGGPGIPADQASRLFLPFERLTDQTSEGSTGTGLGLSIARELAQRMNGQLTLLPSANGALFELTLPTT